MPGDRIEETLSLGNADWIFIEDDIMLSIRPNGTSVSSCEAALMQRVK